MPSTRSNAPDPEAYRAAWREYRTRRNTLIALFAGYFPALTILAVLLRPLHHGERIMDFFARVWFTAGLVAACRWTLWRCPRCGKPFLYASWWGRRCGRCDLPKWAVPDRPTLLSNRDDG